MFMRQCTAVFLLLQVLTENRNLQSETVQSHSLDITEQGTSFANEKDFQRLQ